jgi:phenylalanyl-tRNA synthetase beta chain
VFVECALFDPVRVALSGRRHAVSSDARQRFERGIDPALMPAALSAATRMIIELCGGEASETVEAGAEPAWRREAALRFSRLESFGGLAVPADEAVARLERLGFGVTARDAAQVTVSIPSWRNDIAQRSPLEPSPDLTAETVAKVEAGRAEIEPEADLIEEVLRLGGLDAVPPVSMPGIAPIPSPTLTTAQSRAALARRVLAARGLAECVTFSFMRRERAALFGDAQALLAVDNPISADLDTMRPTPLATLAEAAARNAARGEPAALLFEVGPAFHPELANRQRLMATGLRAGATPRHWAEPSRAYDAMDAKADLWVLLAALGVPMEALTVTADAPAYFHPGRSGTVRQGPKTVLGHFGVLHPLTSAALDLPQAAGFALDLDAIAEPKRRKRAAPDLPPLQPVRRDFAFVVDATVAAETLLRAARGAERNLISGVSLFDRYEGDKIPNGKVSLGIEVTLQPRDKTLTEAEIEAAAAKIVTAVAKATGGVLRG